MKRVTGSRRGQSALTFSPSQLPTDTPFSSLLNTGSVKYLHQTFDSHHGAQILLKPFTADICSATQQAQRRDFCSSHFSNRYDVFFFVSMEKQGLDINMCSKIFKWSNYKAKEEFVQVLQIFCITKCFFLSFFKIVLFFVNYIFGK